MKIEDTIKNFIFESLKVNFSNFDKYEMITIEHPKDGKFGEYAFTGLIKIFSDLKKRNPSLKDLDLNKTQQSLLDVMNGNLPEEILKIELAGPGFINFYLSPKFFHGSIEEILNNKNFGNNNLYLGKKIMVEYTDPNPFKPFHIGHLMTNAIGESVARILEKSGAEISRANYQGDVGLHVARAMYGLLKNESLQDTSGTITEQSLNIGEAYVYGSGAYEADPEAKKEIDEINKKIYFKSDEKINYIYNWGFKVTMQAFEDLYKLLGTKFDYYFLESQVADFGLGIVEENKSRRKVEDARSKGSAKIFTESDGAIVFKAEEHDSKLHTRVFITSQGLPTYETKELGLTVEKFKTKPGMNLSIVVTANEQLEYMRVVAKALSLIYPEYTDKMKHITHGMMRLSTGKMSSRKGNIVTGESLIRNTIELVQEKIKDRDWDEDFKKKISEQVGVSAIKYSILKQSTGGDIAYDFETSISFEGDSGPYLQYSYARARSVLEKAAKENILPDPHSTSEEIFEIEKLLYRFPEVVERSAREYEPHYIANYLIEVARSFNSFYGNNVIVKKEDKNSAYLVALTFAFTFVMKKGLHLLGIEAPEKM